MGAASIQQMANRVAQLMAKRFAIRAATLSEALRKAGRKLPRKVLVAAKMLAQAEENSRNAKLLMQINEAEVASAYDLCVNHLNSGSRATDLKRRAINVAATIASIVLVVALGLILLLRWRGYL